MGTFATWIPEERPEWAHHGGHGWLREMYFRFSAIAIVEYGALIAATLIFAAYLW